MPPAASNPYDNASLQLSLFSSRELQYEPVISALWRFEIGTGPSESMSHVESATRSDLSHEDKEKRARAQTSLYEIEQSFALYKSLKK
jgi:hypothetical protein